ncbi:hypothetical protein ACFYTC_35150 [Actinomadura nitritigenes]|uniref:hypothetical protein n=1 Tax=Actinomadura nitritigenes TaxID=134602 RepID=UPI0036D160E0
MTVGTSTSGIIGRARRTGPASYSPSPKSTSGAFRRPQPRSSRAPASSGRFGLFVTPWPVLFSLGREGVLPGSLSRTHVAGRLSTQRIAGPDCARCGVVMVFAFSGKTASFTLSKWFTKLYALGVIHLLALTLVAVVA